MDQDIKILARWIKGLCPHCLEQIDVDAWEDSKSTTCPYCSHPCVVDFLLSSIEPLLTSVLGMGSLFSTETESAEILNVNL